jgi:hypothetical protein
MAVLRWCWLTLVAGGALTGLGQARQQHGPEWLDLTGADWRRMEPDARLAYVEGFLAGAAVGQAAAGARDSAGVRSALEELSRSGKLRFPYAPNVYASRISDYYWWTNHLPLPTWSAFLEVNTTLGRSISDSLP